jgi:hypothetical protein
MADLDGQTTDRLLQDTSPYTPRVLLRGSLELVPTVVYSAGKISTYSLDITYLNIENTVPEIVLYRGGSLGLTGPYEKCPYFLMDSSGNISEFVRTWISTGSAKVSGDTTVKFNISYYSRSSTRFYFYFQLLSTPVADRDQSEFPYLGSYTT